MMTEYNYILGLAATHKYSTFTPLQECAFRNDATYDNNRDLFILGETSSGKTLIPLLLYLSSLEKNAHKEGVSSTATTNNNTATKQLKTFNYVAEHRPKMLFAVPYRALAAQKVKEMRDFFEEWNLKIVQSTGEYRQDDESVINGKVDIAVVITEKVYKFEACSPSFLSQYDFVVLDEIGLIDNRERGIRLDFLLAWAKIQKSKGKPRLIVLGTPFFDWSAYIDSYDFTEIKVDKRPVSLNETLIDFNSNLVKVTNLNNETTTSIRIVTGKEIVEHQNKYNDELKTGCHLLPNELCPVMKACRLDPTLECSQANGSCIFRIAYLPDEMELPQIKITDILISLCRKQLELERQVLIFCNNREVVKNYCKILYDSLKDLLPESPTGEECQRQILDASELESDDLYGIMGFGEDDEINLDFYRMFVSGIAFHSAALPNELRTYIENNFLESRKIKIVCSTETLAFGVNSSVDTVIIASIIKNISGETRTITNDEYRNYLGRAGRLCIEKPSEKISGYVYTLISKKQRKGWGKLHESAKNPKHMCSLLLTESNDKMPFFILNMLPFHEKDIVTQKEIVEMLRILPKEESCTEDDIRSSVNVSLHDLLKYGLVKKTITIQLSNSDELVSVNPIRKVGYCLTDKGERMRGFIINKSDYELLIKALSECVVGIFMTPNTTKFLYLLLKTKHAENGLNSIFEHNDSMRMDEDEVKSFIKENTNDEMDDLEWLNNISGTKGHKILYILATTIAWSQGKTAKYLYRKFGVHYALISRLTEHIAYLIEITHEIIPFCLYELYNKKKELYLKLGLTSEQYGEILEEKDCFIKKFYISIKFGVNTNVYTKLLQYLNSDAVVKSNLAARAAQLSNELSPSRINPSTARLLKRITVRYIFFEDPLKTEFDSENDKEKYLSQLKQYIIDVQKMEEILRGFFIGAKYYMHLQKLFQQRSQK